MGSSPPTHRRPGTAFNRARYHRDVAAGPFYGFNRPGASVEGINQNWWRQGMKGGVKVYPGYPHGMSTTHADTINPDLLAFIQA
jgi:hypothetical protein